MKRLSQGTGFAPHTRSVVRVWRSPVKSEVSAPFTSNIVAPGMWPAGCAVTSTSPMSTLSPKSIVRNRRRAVRKSPSSKGASKPSASAILSEFLEQQVGHVRGRRRQDDVDVLPTGDPGDHPRVVQVGMTDEHAIDRRGGDRILRRIAGQEAVVEEEGRRPFLEDHPEAADLRRAAEKLEIHPGRPSMPPASIRPSHRKGGSAVGSESRAPCAAVRSG